VLTSPLEQHVDIALSRIAFEEIQNEQAGPLMRYGVVTAHLLEASALLET
jgi:hypothetical protein